MKVVFCRGPGTKRSHASGPVLGMMKEDLTDGALGCSPAPGKVAGAGPEGMWLMGDVTAG